MKTDVLEVLREMASLCEENNYGELAALILASCSKLSGLSEGSPPYLEEIAHAQRLVGGGVGSFSDCIFRRRSGVESSVAEVGPYKTELKWRFSRAVGLVQ